MFKIDSDKKRMSELPKSTFSDLGIREREDLQEWIANTPEALGEELLVIQKEFAGFDETRERLDLLALDKDGSLVIIENKLDDTGRDVVWQALKYVAYCSTLKKSEIVEMFQDYLRKQGRGGEDASRLICDFLEAETMEEISLNSGSDPRVILVAANFRKEVTSTVLWLISKGVKARCMKATPYVHGDEILLDINQIIPTPEAEDYMIKMSSKDSEEKEASAGRAHREQIRLKFWEQMLNHFQEKGLDLYSGRGPSDDPWLDAGSGVSGCSYRLIFSRQEVRVEFVLQRASMEENKRVFASLHDRKKGEIEGRFGAELRWERLDDKKSSCVRYSKSIDIYDEENWPEINQWLFEHVKRMETAFSPVIDDIKSMLR
ncbi:MAG: DUF4268 domain-containing protein [Alphaproteobacteria bacterium]|nr:DUF4268 domain-containing protein [Alphaproteobacteria bacterium]MDA8010459.1 DUF4268 domain-containing protein [Alphaproteobacteria bacterium]